MLGKASIKKSPVDERNEKTEFENILFFNLFEMICLETTTTKFKVGNSGFHFLGEKVIAFASTTRHNRLYHPIRFCQFKVTLF